MVLFFMLFLLLFFLPIKRDKDANSRTKREREKKKRVQNNCILRASFHFIYTCAHILETWPQICFHFEFYLFLAVVICQSLASFDVYVRFFFFFNFLYCYRFDYYNSTLRVTHTHTKQKQRINWTIKNLLLIIVSFIIFLLAYALCCSIQLCYYRYLAYIYFPLSHSSIFYFWIFRRHCGTEMFFCSVYNWFL